MNAQDIVVFLQKELAEGIERVLSSDEPYETWESPYHSGGDVALYLEEKHGVSIETYEMETNGWELAYWQPVMIGHKAYLISGEGWYGGVEFERNNSHDENEVV